MYTTRFKWLMIHTRKHKKYFRNRNSRFNNMWIAYRANALHIHPLKLLSLPSNQWIKYSRDTQSFPDTDWSCTQLLDSSSSLNIPWWKHQCERTLQQFQRYSWCCTRQWSCQMMDRNPF